MTDISKNITQLKTQIQEYESRYHRLPGSVSLLAVSKTQATEKILIALSAGQNQFGESYLQEALPKITALADQNIIWHFIGPLQSNKTKKIAENFSWVHSVCDLKIAQRLNSQRPSHLPPLNICLQINTSEEASKSGASIDEAEKLIPEIANLPHLRLRGLMAIPAIKKNFQEQRAEFKKLRLLAENFSGKGFYFDTLSMGMSDDVEAAIAEGSTLVRIGAKIFGSR
jgi:pyridoxal phosphate enzyme (YggS family)